MKTILHFALLCFTCSAIAAPPFPHPKTKAERDANLFQRADYSKDAYPERGVQSAERGMTVPELPTVSARTANAAAIAPAPEEDAPQTWPVTITWDAQWFGVVYTLSVGTFQTNTLLNVVSNVPVQLGTNLITCSATNAAGAAVTNKEYLVFYHRDIYPKPFTTDTILGPHTTLTALPGVITDPLSDKFFGWEILATNRLDGTNLP